MVFLEVALLLLLSLLRPLAWQQPWITAARLLDEHPSLVCLSVLLTIYIKISLAYWRRLKRDGSSISRFMLLPGVLQRGTLLTEDPLALTKVTWPLPLQRMSSEESWNTT